MALKVLSKQQLSKVTAQLNATQEEVKEEDSVELKHTQSTLEVRSKRTSSVGPAYNTMSRDFRIRKKP